MCRPIGKFLWLLWQHCCRPWSFTCEPFSFDSGRTGFVWVWCVWNGSADPKSRQMRGAWESHHVIPEVFKTTIHEAVTEKIREQKIVSSLGAENVNGRSQNETGGSRAEVSHAVLTGMRWVSGLVSSSKETSRWEKVGRRLWGARRSRDVVQSAGGRLLWLGDTEAGSKT
jgi:hypothetical protein